MRTSSTERVLRAAVVLVVAALASLEGALGHGTLSVCALPTAAAQCTLWRCLHDSYRLLNEPLLREEPSTCLTWCIV